MKFNRNYRLTIELENEIVIIEPPLTISFSITRSTMSSLNSMQLNIVNLAPKTRSKIFQDRFNPKKYKKIILQAGYNELSNIFVGNIFSAISSRNGTEIMTSIDARDGGFDSDNTFSSRTVEEGMSKENLIKSLISDFSKVKLGKINIKGNMRRPVVIDGNTFQIIKKYTDDKIYIDLETAYALQDNDVIIGQVPLITSETGLLGTPKREGSFLSVDTIFEPRIVMGQIIEVKSSIAPVFDGQYKVVGVKHQATISEAVAGTAKSTFSLLVGSQLFGGFNNV